MTKFNPQVDPSHYDTEYDSKERFISYWHQIKLVVDARPDSVLEVGIGNGFVSRYLRNLGVSIQTLDADERLEPDTVGLVGELPFDDNSFDMACCFETLEHLPWDNFATSVAELRRVARSHVMLSLPDITPYVRVDFEWGDGGNLLHELADMPNMTPPEHEFDGQHYWEVGADGYSLQRIVETVESQGLKVEDKFRPWEKPYHRFLKCCVR